MIIGESERNAGHWCFAIGFGRTGTTVVTEIISAHEDAKMFSEAWFWGYVEMLQIPSIEISTPNTSKYRAMEYFNAEMPENVGAAISNYAMANALPDGEISWHAESIRTFLESIREILLRGVDNNTSFGDKFWYYRYILDDVLRVFPECKLILTTRNKWDLAASSMDSKPFQERRPGLSRDELAKVALERAELMCKQDKELFQKHTNLFEINFERMADNPQSTISDLLDYLYLSEEGFNWNIIDKLRHKQAMRHWERIPELAKLHDEVDS